MHCVDQEFLELTVDEAMNGSGIRMKKRIQMLKGLAPDLRSAADIMEIIIETHEKAVKAKKRQNGLSRRHEKLTKRMADFLLEDTN